MVSNSRLCSTEEGGREGLDENRRAHPVSKGWNKRNRHRRRNGPVAARLLSARLGERKEKGCAQMLPGPFPAMWGHFLSILLPAAPAVAKFRLWTQKDVSLELSSGIS